MTPAKGCARDRQLDLDFPKMTLTNVGFTFCIFFKIFTRSGLAEPGAPDGELILF